MKINLGNLRKNT